MRPTYFIITISPNYYQINNKMQIANEEQNVIEKQHMKDALKLYETYSQNIIILKITE